MPVLWSRRAITGRHDRLPANAACCHFPPDPSGWDLRLPLPVALSSSPRRCSASARQCLQGRRIRQAPLFTRPRRRPLVPTPETARGSNWRCQNAPPVWLSTDNPFSAHRGCPPIPAGGLWACARRPRGGCRSDLQNAGGRESAAPRAPRNQSVTSPAFAFVITPPATTIAHGKILSLIYG